jgi:hypothetical protein
MYHKLKWHDEYNAHKRERERERERERVDFALLNLQAFGIFLMHLYKANMRCMGFECPVHGVQHASKRLHGTT